MRKRNFLCRLAAFGVVAELLLVGAMTGNQAHAKNDFDALLAEVNFGAPAPAAPQSPEALQLPAGAAADELNAPPTSVPLSMPPGPADAQSAPAPQAAHAGPVGVTPVPVHHESFAVCDGQCNGCGGKCGSGGCKMFQEGFCQPYTPPQLPSSTFYQYWRSNACNVNVWNGYRNRCHTRVDLSMHHNKSLCGKKLFGCKSGACENVYNSPVAVDCGPAPSEWCEAGCDTCDGQ